MLELIVGMVVAAFVLLGVGFWLGRNKAFTQSSKSLSQASENAGFLEGELEKTKRLLAAHQTANEDLQKERNHWNRLFWQEALGHSAAQSLCLREIVRLVRLCRVNKINVSVQPRLREVVQDHFGQFVAEIPEAERQGVKAPVEVLNALDAPEQAEKS